MLLFCIHICAQISKSESQKVKGQGPGIVLHQHILLSSLLLILWVKVKPEK